jgi:hypothetical protein
LRNSKRRSKDFIRSSSRRTAPSLPTQIKRPTLMRLEQEPGD